MLQMKKEQKAQSPPDLLEDLQSRNYRPCSAGWWLLAGIDLL
jgi:hypothetical protein